MCWIFFLAILLFKCPGIIASWNQLVIPLQLSYQWPRKHVQGTPGTKTCFLRGPLHLWTAVLRHTLFVTSTHWNPCCPPTAWPQGLWHWQSSSARWEAPTTDCISETWGWPQTGEVQVSVCYSKSCISFQASSSTSSFRAPSDNCLRDDCKVELFPILQTFWAQHTYPLMSVFSISIFNSVFSINLYYCYFQPHYLTLIIDKGPWREKSPS